MRGFYFIKIDYDVGMTYIIDAHQDISFNGMCITGRDFFKENNINTSLLQSGDALSQSDYIRLTKAKVKIVFSVIFPYQLSENQSDIICNEELGTEETLKQLHYYRNLEEESLGRIKIIENKADLDQVLNNEGMIGFVLLLEDAMGIKKDLSNLQELYDLGLRIIGPVWNRDNQFSGGTDSDEGLTQEGKELLAKMQTIGFALDTAHMNQNGFNESLDIFSGVVINSHAGIFKVTKHRRNLHDEQLVKIKEKGGVVGLPFVPEFIHSDKKEASLEHYVNHVKHAIEIIGINHIAFGSDFDGMSWPQYMKEVQDVSFFNKVVERLQLEFSSEEVNIIAHGNWLRILEKILPER